MLLKNRGWLYAQGVHTVAPIRLIDDQLADHCGPFGVVIVVQRSCFYVARAANPDC
jgi:hypothetical protein